MPGFVPRSFNDALVTRSDRGEDWSRGVEGPTVGGSPLGAKMSARRWKRQDTGSSAAVPPRFAEEVKANPGHFQAWGDLFRSTADGFNFGAPPPEPEPQSFAQAGTDTTKSSKEEA